MRPRLVMVQVMKPIWGVQALHGPRQMGVSSTNESIKVSRLLEVSGSGHSRPSKLL
jgi:hypothetical protein